MHTASSAVVHTSSLTKRYGTVDALRGIDLHISAGGIIGILGPNGAGKTTLIEILEGLRQPTAGSVSVLGLDPARQPRDLKGRIGVQLQATHLPADLEVREVVQLFASFYERALPLGAVLERVGLESHARARVGTLSGGQKQRVALAIALVHDPELILLDEPTSGLDPAARRGLHDVVRELKRQGRTTLLTTHYIEEAEQLCDRVVMMRRGEIVADGTPFDLVGRSRGQSTLWIAVDGTLDAGPLTAAGAKYQGQQGEHHRFTITDPARAIAALGDLLRDQRLSLMDLRLKRPTLEDVYLEIVGQAEAEGATPPPANEAVLQQGGAP